MRLLLDTHALLWWLDGDERLSKPARQAIAEPTTIVIRERRVGLGDRYQRWP